MCPAIRRASDASCDKFPVDALVCGSPEPFMRVLKPIQIQDGQWCEKFRSISVDKAVRFCYYLRAHGVHVTQRHRMATRRFEGPRGI